MTSSLENRNRFSRIKSYFLLKTLIIKSYVCIFVCFNEADHIEIIIDLTTRLFLNVFFDNSGKSVRKYLDNATNFVSVNNTLKEVCQFFQLEQHKKKTQEKLTDIGIYLDFISFRSPHFGGLYEAAVKSMKILLSRMLGEVYLMYSFCIF